MAFYLYKKFVRDKRRSRNSNENGMHELVDTDYHKAPATTARTNQLSTSDSRIDQQTNIIESNTESQPNATAEEKKAARRYRWKIVIGLALPFAVQALDLTIIASAIPFIASDFNQLSQLNWIVSAFNLTDAAFIPFWGQFADIFGRYVALQSASLVTLIGTALCAGAPVTAFPMLLFGRALQGAGCAGLLIVTKTVLADKVSLQENSRNNTTFTIVAGIAYGIGPVIGGYLTEVSWRWCFIINIPIGLLGIVLTHFVLRKELLGPQRITRLESDSTETEIPQTFFNKIATIDFGGQFLFLFGIGLLVLALTWAGSYYPWNDVKVIVPLILAVLLIAFFFAYEYLLGPGRPLSRLFSLQKPMIPMRLLISRNCGLLMYINFCTGMAMYAIFYFASLYFVLVESFPAGKAGQNLLYYMPGLGVGAYMAMFACNQWPLRTWWPLSLGTLIEPIGVTMMALAIHSGHLPWLYGMLGLTGVGSGIRFMPGTLHGVGYHRTNISQIISLMSLSQALGGTIATTLMLNIFNNYLSQRGISFSPSSGADSSASLEGLANLSPEQSAFFKSTVRQAIILAFFALTAFLWLGLVACAALGSVKIGKDGRPDRLVRGSYLGSWFKKDYIEDENELAAGRK